MARGFCNVAVRLCARFHEGAGYRHTGLSLEVSGLRENIFLEKASGGRWDRPEAHFGLGNFAFFKTGHFDRVAYFERGRVRYR
jgi:hypothetical protein